MALMLYINKLNEKLNIMEPDKTKNTDIIYDKISEAIFVNLFFKKDRKIK